MQKILKRGVALLVLLAMLLVLIPANTLAADIGSGYEEISLPSEIVINPLYADVITEADLVQPTRDDCDGAAALTTAADGSTTSLEEAGEVLRAGLKSRQESIEVAYTVENSDYSEVYKALFAEATTHTGVPTEGDYLRWQYAGYSVKIGGTRTGTVYNYTFTFTVTYYTTTAQEAQLDTAVAGLLDELTTTGMSRYEKLTAVYDYITANVSYDYTNLEDTNYKLKYTAYAALVNKTAVCQGYAVLLYRLALTLGIDARVITGTAGGSHAWNIVQLGDAYYYADATWDVSVRQVFHEYWYYLRGSDTLFVQGGTYKGNSISAHVAGEAYQTDEFAATYPVSSADYDPAADSSGDANADSGSIGDSLFWSINASGALTITGTGNLPDYSAANQAPWYPVRGRITSAVLDYSGSIGAFSFYDCNAMQSVAFGSGITGAIGSSAFSLCKSLSTLQLPSGITSIGASAFNSCESLTALVLPASVNSIGSFAFSGCKSLATVDFLGNRPSFGTNCFYGLTATVYYHEDNTTWSGCTLEEDYEDITLAQRNHTCDAVVTEPTCTAKGYTTYTCSVCGYSYNADETPVSAHSYTSVVTEPTCTAKGYTTYTCSVCGTSYNADETPAGHSYAAVVTEPGCTADGYTTHTCSGCGDSYTDTPVAATGHSYGDWTTTKAATCTQDGTQTRTCKTCGKNDTKTITTLGHRWDADYTTDQEATCTAAGSKSIHCSRCGATKDAAEIPAAGHTTVTDAAVAPTCIEDGKTAGTHCSVCQAVLTEQLTVPAKGHTTVTDAAVAPTCIEDGKTAGMHCSVCNAVLTEQATVPAVGHSYVAVVTEPTTTNQGYTTHTCSRCGDSYVDSYTDPVPEVKTGWQKVDGKWYYYNTDGTIATSKWIKSGTKWYYVGADGVMATAKWIKSGTKWYYVGTDGVMATAKWIKSGTKWYYVGSDGVMATSKWIKSSGKWYYVGSDGVMYTSKWLKSGSSWYYLKSSGVMAANESLAIKGKTYHFNASGVCTNP